MNRSFVRVIPFLFAFLWPVISVAQHDYTVWCFGNGAGISFAGPSPVPISSSLRSLEGAASISDPVTGALLFYTDGEKVFNADHVPMPNGTGLQGSVNSAQSALIIPRPNAPRTFYVFTSDAGIYDQPPNEGIHYSIVDMRLDGGRGEVTTKNVQLLPDASERLTAIRHRDRCSYWILTHGWDDDVFRAFLVNDAGVAAAPVESRVGVVHQDPPGRAEGSSSIGVIKASPDGSYLAVTTFSMGIVQLFRFDNATGVVYDPLDLPVQGDSYGASFSPDNSKLYISSQPAILTQFDLSSPDPGTIIASRHVLAYDTDRFARYPFGFLQMGPDGRIYLARVNGQRMDVIEQPNAAGAACNYRPESFDLGAGRQCWLGLPNLADSYFDGGTLTCGAPIADFVPADADICAGDCLTFTDRSGNDPESWSWAFPGAVPSSSTERNPANICYAEPGIYRATLRATNAVGFATITRTVIVRPRGQMRGHIGRDFQAEPGDTIEIPVMLDAGTIPAGTGRLTFTFRYGPGMMRLLDAILAGTMLERWHIDSLGDDPIRGVATLRMVPPPGEGLQGAGSLVRLKFGTFLGWADSSSLGFEMSADSMRCLNGAAEAGFVRLEYCALGSRFIELSGESFALGDGHPNPFNPTTEIPFTLPFDTHATLAVFDVAGRCIATLTDGPYTAGRHTVTWDASAFPSGTYYCRLQTAEGSMTRELVLRR